MRGESALSIFLCGDVMPGRGIDQVLSHPSAPQLFESSVRDARDYVRLAEALNGPIPRAVDDAYPWGDALETIRAVDARIINFETSITSSDAAWPGKGIQYRMHPRNVGVLTAARIDCCCLGNNHVLDWGYPGLDETLLTLDSVGIAHPGAGRDALAAGSPAVLDVPGKGRILVVSLGHVTSGVPPEWAATEDKAGINWLRDLSLATARTVTRPLRHLKRSSDVAIASIHWGPNWGYDVPDEQKAFARWLIEGGFDVVHGHSSHHMKALEVYRERLILYGCGDFMDDYEGIRGNEAYRPDLRLGYLLRVDPMDGTLLEARLELETVRRFRLHHASESDVLWTCQLLNRLSAPFGTQVHVRPDLGLSLQWH